MASKPMTPEEVDRAIELYESGQPAREIGDALGRQKDTIIRVLRANGIQIRPRGQAAGNMHPKCKSYERFKEEAMFGSLQLLLAIERAGVRPC